MRKECNKLFFEKKNVRVKTFCGEKQTHIGLYDIDANHNFDYLIIILNQDRKLNFISNFQ